MSRLLADYEADWDIGYAPIGGGQHVLRAVLRTDRQVIITGDSAAEIRDAIEARKATA